MENRLINDPRIDPRIKALIGNAPLGSMPDMPNRQALIEAMSAVRPPKQGDPPSLMEVMASADFEAIVPSAGVDVRQETVVSVPDGNRINIQVITPEGRGPWPCVYYIHGGGMMSLSCYDPNYRAWGRMIARQGVKVAMVDFRNAVLPSSVPETAPYPAGLNDCVSGLRWLRANAAELNIKTDRIVIAGESGGANLSVATALKLKRDGDLAGLAGLYLMCPYLAGEWSGAAGSSALENAGILMDVRSNFGAMAYGIEQLRARNPLAWPGFATEHDLIGFPPVVINVNELDPLRDDGVILYRKLLKAGVPARCRQLMGTSHGTEVMVACCPDISRDVARDMAAFCAGAT